MTIREALKTISMTQAMLARHLAISPAAVSLIINYGIWPKSISPDVLQAGILACLRDGGLDEAALQTLFEKRPAACANTLPAYPQPEAMEREDITMLLRKQTLTREAKAHFRLSRDPFTDEMASDADVFTSDDVRYVRASMRQVAQHGGLLAVIGESGAGKSTLRHDLIDWIRRNNEPITVIEPYVLGMEDTDNKGRMLKAADITGAVIRAVSPGTHLRRSHQDRAEQMHTVLRKSGELHRKHLLIIEEAHCLATPTLKHLKRFYEIQDGFRKLLSIILIGQTELEWRLSEQNPEVREVVQRCEFARIEPLGANLEGYLRHKFARIEVDAGAIIEPSAIEAMNAYLRANVQRRVNGRSKAETVSLCYPLAVNNLISGALNQAARISAPKVNDKLIEAVIRREV